MNMDCVKHNFSIYQECLQKEINNYSPQLSDNRNPKIKYYVPNSQFIESVNQCFNSQM
jgi:hypothetical protein